MPCPRSAAGSWWRRARIPAGPSRPRHGGTSYAPWRRRPQCPRKPTAAPPAASWICRTWISRRRTLRSWTSVWSVGRTSALANCCKPYVGRDPGPVNVRGKRLPSVLDRRVERNRPRVGHDRRGFCIDRLERAVVGDELVEHVLDRYLGLVGTGIAHVVMPEAGVDDRDPGLLALFGGRNDPGVSLEDRVLRTEGQDLEPAVGDERHAQVIERHDLLDLFGILLGEIHRDVAAHRMSHHGQTTIVGIGLNLLHFADRKMDIGDATLNLRQTADIELTDLGHHRGIGRQIMLRAEREIAARSKDVGQE